MTKEQQEYLNKRPLLKKAFECITENEITFINNMPFEVPKRNSNEDKVMKNVIHKLCDRYSKIQKIQIIKDFTIRMTLGRWTETQKTTD